MILTCLQISDLYDMWSWKRPNTVAVKFDKLSNWRVTSYHYMEALQAAHANSNVETPNIWPYDYIAWTPIWQWSCYWITHDRMATYWDELILWNSHYTCYLNRRVNSLAPGRIYTCLQICVMKIYFDAYWVKKSHRGWTAFLAISLARCQIGSRNGITDALLHPLIAKCKSYHTD